MSFRLFIYYCAAWGGAAAYIGWALSQLVESKVILIVAAVKGMALGLFVSLALSVLDYLSASSHRGSALLCVRMFLAVLVGSVAGLAGGPAGQAFRGLSGSPWAVPLGWALAGLLIGLAASAFDFLSAVIRIEDRRGARRKLRNGLLGGGIGGLLGGTAAVLLDQAWLDLFRDSGAMDVWSPEVAGFVALGACIGLVVAVTQVIFGEAWVRVESGFRPGRQFLLTRPETVIGQGETCDVRLFGDPGVEKVHTRIRREGNGWFVSDAGTPTGTTLNGEALVAPKLLHSGDRIQIADCILSFGARTKVEINQET